MTSSIMSMELLRKRKFLTIRNEQKTNHRSRNLCIPIFGKFSILGLFLGHWVVLFTFKVALINCSIAASLRNFMRSQTYATILKSENLKEEVAICFWDTFFCSLLLFARVFFMKTPRSIVLVNARKYHRTDLIYWRYD